MTSLHSPEFEQVNKQLLQNQSFLYNENQKLQDDVKKLSYQLENLRKTSVKPEIFDALKKEKNHLLTLNETFKRKLQQLRAPPGTLTPYDAAKELKEKDELLATVRDLDELISKVKCMEKFEVKPPQEDLHKMVNALTSRLEEEQQKSHEADETIRKLRQDDEKYIMREKLVEMKQLVTDLEIENSKLKFEIEQLNDDVDTYKRQLDDATEELKQSAARCCQLEDEKDKLKESVSELENEKIELKKEMIQEMTEANRAKRVSVDTEIALQHIAEAYETKRKEMAALMQQQDDAESIIKEFKDQFAAADNPEF
ncbi:unnamed protein product [Acanthoscelides obtectus]|uniref:Uncharacterized protein n=1 Tax=Acanthoscelides obtectus TaxID=200917 RepID=A0A9P0QA39_ACAOB|nr:unnamed protein product [Acanthoscelides obtectus]CAK1639626.1 hypothetical protein AOBTE_LOCUS11283 [Acanthoscelides obtectus]